MRTADPLAAIKRYIDAFNQGDVEGMAGLCTDSASILDGMAPHLWQGPNAARDWYSDVLSASEFHGTTEYFVTLADPVPATMTFEVNGNQVTQTEAFFTVALRRLADGWRIAAWAWTKGKRDSA